MRIAIIMDRFEQGGVTTHNLTLAKALMEIGHQVFLYAAAASKANIDYLNQNGDLFQYKLWEDNPVQDLKSFQPDIIHAHPFQALKKGFEISQALKAPLFITSHGSYPIGLDRSKASKNKCNNIKRIISVDYIPHYHLFQTIACPEKISIIPNGIDLDHFQPFESDPKYKLDLDLNPDWFTITSVSRLGDGKHQTVGQLINCSKEIASNIDGLNIIIVGGGPYYTHIKNQVKSLLKNEKNINCKVVGYQFDVRNFVAASDLVIGCGRVALEAIACKRPVLCSYGDGVKELFTPDNYNKFLYRHRMCPPLDDKELIKLLIKTVKNNDSNKATLNKSLHLVKRNHDIKDIAQQHVRLYQEYL